MTKLDSLNKLISLEPNLLEIYEATPFDPERNIDGDLDFELFLDLFFYKKSCEKAYKEIYEFLNSKHFSRKIIFLTGYSGIGKTTLLNYSMKRISDSFHWENVDFSKIPDFSSTNPISDGIKHFIARNYIVNNDNDRDWFFNTIEHIYNNENDYMQLLSHATICKVAEFIETDRQTDKIKNRLLNELLNSLIPVDTFTILLVILFNNIEENKKVIISFDNLDIIDLDFITQAFLKDFQKLHNNCSELSQRINLYGKKISFSRRFKFIFVLREANFAKNPHILSALGKGYIHYIFESKASDTKEIIKLRGEIFDKICEVSNCEDEVSIKTNNLIKHFAGDFYFENCIINLFNRDFKKLVLNLSSILDNKYFFSNLIYAIYRSGFNFYEQRGAILFWFINYLKSKELLDEVLSIEPLDTQNGYCEIGRMILNYILNKSGLQFSINTHDFNNNRKHCNLYDIAEAFYKVYPPKEIIDNLYNQYRGHKNLNWVNTLVIYNKKIINRIDLHEEEELLDEYFNLKDEGKESERKTEIRKKLEKIEFGITPSGYSILRYILIHFEYFSNMDENENRLSRKPLFLLGLKRKKSEKYLFEEKISFVIKKIKQSAKQQKLFYENIISLKLNDGQVFEDSNYSFKYSGFKKSKKGSFYITRIISSNIQYIDNFRLHLLKKQELTNEERETINKILIKFIIELKDILNNYSLDYRRHFIVSELNKQLDIIIHDYSNFTERIIFPEQIED